MVVGLRGPERAKKKKEGIADLVPAMEVGCGHWNEKRRAKERRQQPKAAWLRRRESEDEEAREGLERVAA